MYSRWRERLRHTLGFRLALWYAIVFVASSLALTGLTYFLVDASLRQYDREMIGTALVQYAEAYQAGGVAGLQEEIQRTQATAAPGPLLVRVVGSAVLDARRTSACTRASSSANANGLVR